MRWRDIRGATFPDNPFEGWEEPPRLADVFTSELAVAMLLRLHVNAPGLVVSGQRVSRTMCHVLKQAVEDGLQLISSGRPRTPNVWNENDEQLLISAIEHVLANHASVSTLVGTAGRDNLVETLNTISNWPSYGSRDALGFQLRLEGEQALEALLTLDGGDSGRLLRTRDSFVFDDTDLPPDPFPAECLVATESVPRLLVHPQATNQTLAEDSHHDISPMDAIGDTDDADDTDIGDTGDADDAEGAEGDNRIDRERSRVDALVVEHNAGRGWAGLV